jgi:CBS domain-containing protein
MATITRNRAELTGRTIAAAITSRGKELSVADTVGAARRLLSRPAVRVLPVLDGTAYVGAVDRDAIPDEVDDAAAVVSVATAFVPTIPAAMPAELALAARDRRGENRRVVLDHDGFTYVGLVCVRSDRRRLCVDSGSLAAAS